jgi:BirA family transcriptional regulator, biotin operon repressor / biotin---[acetyl-CoA-carboxylase] ligase
MNWRVTRFPTLPSTNDLALEWMRSGRAAAGDVLVAGEQTAGRGRPGRQWHSPPGALLLTAVLPFYPERAGWTALAAGAAVARAVRDLGAPAGVKWPNDIVLNGRKLAGILAETPGGSLVALGVGMNVTNPLPGNPAVAPRSTRLADLVPGVTVEAVEERILARLAEVWTLLAAPDLRPLRQAWEELDATVGRRLRWSEEGITGTAQGVAPTGALLIRTDDGRVVTAAVGEVGFLE